ncbi:hypothetical protein T492DRAFT_841677 [Pavlovales sp. CCMP2436]|nr:hypothetical protein T492DRAFT_841677 [Pavlovales sp. CCMP2436]
MSRYLELLSVVPAEGGFPALTLVADETKVGLLQNLILEARSSFLSAQQAQLSLSPKSRIPLWMFALVGFIVARELLGFIPSFLLPGFVVQLLTIFVFASVALIVLANTAGPRVVLGALGLVSPAAARVAERALAMLGLSGEEAVGAQIEAGPRRAKAAKTRRSAPAAAADESSRDAAADFSD